MSRTDNLMESLRELIAAMGPGLVTSEDLLRLEEKVDELGELLSELEKRLAERMQGDKPAEA